MAQRAHGTRDEGLGRSWLWWLLLLVWVVVLFYASSLPGQPSQQWIPHLDKVKHATYFFIGGLFLQKALRGSLTGWSVRTLILVGIVFAAVVGALDEYHQTFTPGRSGNDVLDWLADVFGGTMAGLCLAGRARRA